MGSERDAQEFAPGDRASAEAYIGGLPRDVRRVYVEEWDGREWRFVFGDDREHAARGLRRLATDSRFRVRCGS
jgi:hypothetical protein